MATVNGTTFSESQLLTRAAPTLATEGQALKDLSSVTVIVEANTSQTLSGAGSLLAYIYDASPGAPAAWVRMPAMDLSVSTSGVQRMAFPAVTVTGARNARLLYAASGVTVSSGTTVTVYQLGFAPGMAASYQ
jgi:hypothetical protein